MINVTGRDTWEILRDLGVPGWKPAGKCRFSNAKKSARSKGSSSAESPAPPKPPTPPRAERSAASKVKLSALRTPRLVVFEN